MMSTKTKENSKNKYYIRINGKRTQVTKEEYEKRYPPVTEETETEETTE